MFDDFVTVDPLKFHGTLVFAWMESINKKLYQTTHPLVVNLPKGLEKVKYADGDMSIADGKLNVVSGFMFDGASGVAIDGVANMLAALIHDCLCHAMSKKAKGLSWKLCDYVYRVVCRAQCAGFCRSWAHYIGLRGFGWVWRIFTVLLIMMVL